MQRRNWHWLCKQHHFMIPLNSMVVGNGGVIEFNQIIWCSIQHGTIHKSTDLYHSTITFSLCPVERNLRKFPEFAKSSFSSKRWIYLLLQTKQTLKLSQFPGEIFCKKSVNENETAWNIVSLLSDWKWISWQNGYKISRLFNLNRWRSCALRFHFQKSNLPKKGSSCGCAIKDIWWCVLSLHALSFILSFLCGD